MGLPMLKDGDVVRLAYDFDTKTGLVEFVAGATYRVADIVDYFEDASSGKVEAIRVVQDGSAEVVLRADLARLK
jgi:hypothetical protein